jgi:hypothetical protein
MKLLRGRRITGADGPIGVLNDVYFDASQWRVRYLALDSAQEPTRCARLIVPAAAARIEGVGAEELIVDLKRSAIPRESVPAPHLVSAREVASLRVRTADGGAARVDDVLIGIDWSIAGFRIPARDWIIPGNAVELAPGAVERLDRERRLLCVRLTQEELQRLPRAAWRIRRG